MPVPDLLPGAVFAGCRIEAVAGRGGMGIVYRATQLSLGRPVDFQDLETEMLARTDAPYVAVRALDARGRVIGRSAAVEPG